MIKRKHTFVFPLRPLKTSSLAQHRPLSENQDSRTQQSRPVREHVASGPTAEARHHGYKYLATATSTLSNPDYPKVV